jgi:TonB family protein
MTSALRFAILIALGLTAIAATPEATPVDREEFFRHIAHYKVPDYPDKSIEDRRTGTVTARVWVDTWGTVKTIDVQVPPDTQMAEAVKQAVSDWTFRPFENNVGKTRNVVCTIHVLFRMAADGPGVIIPGLTKMPEAEYRSRN